MRLLRRDAKRRSNTRATTPHCRSKRKRITASEEQSPRRGAKKTEHTLPKRRGASKIYKTENVDGRASNPKRRLPELLLPRGPRLNSRSPRSRQADPHEQIAGDEKTGGSQSTEEWFICTLCDGQQQREEPTSHHHHHAWKSLWLNSFSLSLAFVPITSSSCRQQQEWCIIDGETMWFIKICSSSLIRHDKEKE